MNLSEEQCRARFDEARVLRLATADAGGHPHLVPATFARLGSALGIAVDSKPKRHAALKRLRNIQENPAVSVLVDEYDDDWNRLWWARADGAAEVKHIADEAQWLSALQARYAQYRRQSPEGPLIVISVLKWAGWSFSE